MDRCGTNDHRTTTETSCPDAARNARPAPSEATRCCRTRDAGDGAWPRVVTSAFIGWNRIAGSPGAFGGVLPEHAPIPGNR